MDRIIYIATRNEHKVAEIKPILINLKVNLKSISGYDEIPEAIEDAHTFAANAKLKAEHYFKYLNKPVVADDSGLVVPALNGEPGIYSARYAGEKSNYALNNKKLLKKMENLSGKERYAYFICSVVYKDENSVLHAEGKCEGRIIFNQRGTEGFGYDPIFEFPELNKTFAEIESEIKNKISHRYLAFKRLSKILNDYWNDIDKSKYRS
jgi:XTP/dITP diphosphohydrolase